MTTKTSDEQDKVPALRVNFTKKFVDGLTYEGALALQCKPANQPSNRNGRRENELPEPDGPAPNGRPSSTPDEHDQDHGDLAEQDGASAPMLPPTAGEAQKERLAGPDSVRVWDTTQRGLGLRLSRNGMVQYFVVGRVRGSGAKRADGKRGDIQRYISLGRPSVAYSLKDARDDAALRLHEMRSGTDASAARQAKEAEAAKMKDSPAALASRITLREIYEDFRKTNTGHGEVRRPRTLENYEHTLNYYLHSIAEQPVSTITKDICHAIFTSISEGTFAPPAAACMAISDKKHRASNGEGAPSVANKAMRILHALLAYAREQFQQPDGTYPILGINPVKAMHRMDKPHKERARTGRVPRERREAFWQALELQSVQGRTEGARTSADWLLFCSLTGIRPGESARMRWGYVDFAHDRLVLPGGHTKNHEKQELPMNAPVRELLEHRLDLYQKAKALPDDAAPLPDDWVFNSRLSKSGHVVGCRKTLKQTSEIIGEDFHLLIYDLRRTFVDMATECHIDFPERQRLINHKGGVLQTNYANGDPALVEAMRLIGEKFTFDPAKQPDPRVAMARMGWHREAKISPKMTDWYALSVWDLAQLVWEKPAAEIARDYGLNGKSVALRCKKLGIRQPGRGYWRKVAVGSIIKKAPPALTRPLRQPPAAASHQTPLG